MSSGSSVGWLNGGRAGLRRQARAVADNLIRSRQKTAREQPQGPPRPAHHHQFEEVFGQTRLLRWFDPRMAHSSRCGASSSSRRSTSSVRPSSSCTTSHPIHRHVGVLGFIQTSSPAPCWRHQPRRISESCASPRSTAATPVLWLAHRRPPASCSMIFNVIWTYALVRGAR